MFETSEAMYNFVKVVANNSGYTQVGMPSYVRHSLNLITQQNGIQQYLFRAVKGPCLFQ